MEPTSGQERPPPSQLKLTAGTLSGFAFSSWDSGNFSSTTANPTCLTGSNSTQNTHVNYTANAANTAPTISNIADQTINEDSNTGALAFTVGDGQTAAASLTLSGSSSNTTLVPNANIVFGGSGASRTVTVTPVANLHGTSTITVTVSDGSLSTSDTFLLTVLSVNDAPAGTNNTVTTNEDTDLHLHDRRLRLHATPTIPRPTPWRA